MRKFHAYLIIAGLTLLCGCDRGTVDWLEGISHISCSTEDDVTAHVQNLSSTDVTLGSCSPDYQIPDNPESFSAYSDISLFRTVVGSHNTDTVVMMGDSCREADDVPASDSVGRLIPLLDAADLQTHKFCLNPNVPDPQASGADVPLYMVVDSDEACPAGSAPFDQTSVHCQ